MNSSNSGVVSEGCRYIGKLERKKSIYYICVYVYVYINIGGDVPRLIAVEGKISPDGRYDLLLFL